MGGARGALRPLPSVFNRGIIIRRSSRQRDHTPRYAGVASRDRPLRYCTCYIQTRDRFARRFSRVLRRHDSLSPSLMQRPMRHGLGADRALPRPLTFGSVSTHDQITLARVITSKGLGTSPRLLQPALTLLTGERMTPRAPKQLPRLQGAPVPPSIPSVDQAWGYAENDDGILELQKPEMPLALPDSGSYSPTTFTLPTAPNYGFGLSSGRDGGRSQHRADDLDLADPPRAAPTAPSVPRMPMPIAANALRTLHLASPRQPQRRISLHPSFPGPGAFNSPRSIGDVREVRGLPPQRRYRARAHLPPRSPQASPRQIRSTLDISRATFLPAPPPPPPRGPASGRLGQKNTADDGKSLEEIMREADERQKLLRDTIDGEQDEFESLRPPPPGLDKRGQKAWQSFVTADASGDGRLSRKELFEALDRQGALDGRAAEWHAAFRAVDDNDDAFIEWEEFQQLVLANPELLNLMRSIDWRPHRAPPLLEPLSQSLPHMA